MKKIADYPITLPQTGEKCLATLELNHQTGIEIKNVKRIAEKQQQADQQSNPNDN